VLERLQLINFQRHENLVLILDPHVTTCVGDTDAGKSSGIRGLLWVALNEPSGDSFIRHGTEEAIGRLYLDGKKVVRRRGKENTYWMSGMGPTERMRSFHSSVPKEVADLLNVKPVNFQEQFDLPFWFMNTAAEVSRQLNQIMNLAAIDQTLSGVATEVRKARSIAEVCRQRLEDAVAKKQELGWVPGFLSDHGNIVFLENVQATKAAQTGSLAALIEEASSVRRGRDKAATAALDGETVLSLAETAHTAGEIRQKLADLLTDIETTAIQMAEEVPDFDAVTVIRAEGDRKAAERSSLEVLVERLSNHEALVCQTQSELATAEKELAEKTKGKCPICGNLLPADKCGSSPAPTYTSARTRRLLERRKTGTESWPDTSGSSGP
jgi:hypothetical protein